MEVINGNVAMLTNFEVLSMLESVLANEKGQKKKGQHQQLATVAYETTEYLKKLPCHLQNGDIIKRFMLAVAPFNLTKAEKLQLLNHRPTTPVEIQLMIEESEERLTEEEVNSLLDVVAEVLPDEQQVEEYEDETMGQA